MKYKALFLDVDGTLVRNYTSELPSIKVTEAIAQARQKGLHVGVVTGRPLSYLENIFDHLQLEGPSIITDGTQVIDSVSRKILWEQVMPKEDVKESLAILQHFAKRIFINDGGDDVIVEESAVWVKPLGIFVNSLPEQEADAAMSALTHIATISVRKFIGSKKGQADLWVSHVNATKQHGILKAAEILGISTKEIIGVGDGYNDFSLMMASGLKVAMGNAIEDLKAVADFVAPTVEEDGVAHVIEKFILQD